MSDEERYRRGDAAYARVYGDDIAPRPPRGSSLYVDVMVEQLFADVWAREALSIRDRRLVVMGALAAQGLADKVELQLRRAVDLGELTLDQAEEVVLQITHYVGWGLASALANVVPAMRAEARERDG